MRVTLISVILLFIFFSNAANLPLSTCADLFQLNSANDYYLTQDLNCTGYPTTFDESYALDNYARTFDGKNFKIVGLKMRPSPSFTSNFGLIKLMNGGSIKDLTMENCTLNLSTSNSDHMYIAFFVGLSLNSGLTNITNCHSIRNTININSNTAIEGVGAILGMSIKLNGLSGCSVISNNFNIKSRKSVKYVGGVAGNIQQSANMIVSNLLTSNSFFFINTENENITTGLGGNVGFILTSSAGTVENLTSTENVIQTGSPSGYGFGGNIGVVSINQDLTPKNFVSSSNVITGGSDIGGNIGQILITYPVSNNSLNFVSCGNILSSLQSDKKTGGNIGYLISSLSIKNFVSVGNTLFGSDGDVYFGSLAGQTPNFSNCSNSNNLGFGVSLTTTTCNGDAPSTLQCPSKACNSTSCGPNGVCNPSSGLCLCQSSYLPLGASLSSCVASSCATPPDFSNTSFSVPNSVYNTRLSSNFNSQGMWQISLEFAQSQFVNRNIRVVSSSGQVCKDFNDDLANAASTSSLSWAQSINSSSCKDVISANLQWSVISDCLRSASNPNVYSGQVVSITTLSNINFNQTTIGRKKREVTTTQFVNNRNFSVNFETTVQANSSDTQFIFSNGTTIVLNVNVSSPNNMSSLIDLIATIFNISPNMILVDPLIDSSFSGNTQLNITILDDFVVGNDSSLIAKTINEMINNGTLSAGNMTAFNLTSFLSSKKAFIKLISNVFDSSTLKLTLVYQLRISTPLAASSSGVTFTSNTASAALIGVVMLADGGCDTDYCLQNVTVVYDLSSKVCNQVNENSVMGLTLACQSSYSSSDCNNLLSLFGGKKILVPVTFGVEWCPVQQKTQISVVSFELFSNGSKIVNQQVIKSNNTIVGVITLNIDSLVPGSTLFNTSVTSLVLSDSLKRSSLDVSKISQSYSVKGQTSIVVEFVHVFSPSSINLDFSKALFYVADVDVLFGVQTSKRTRAISFTEESYSVQQSSVSFIVESSNVDTSLTNSPSSTTTTTNTPTKSPLKGSNNKSSVVAIAVGVSVGVSAMVLILIAALILMRRRNGSNGKKHKMFERDEEIELQFQKNSHKN